MDGYFALAEGLHDRALIGETAIALLATHA